MRQGSSTLLTRLALALLAVLGFVAPLAAPEADRVVQTAGGKPAPVAPREVTHAAEPQKRAVTVPNSCITWVSCAHVESSARRYLLNRAWLV